MALALAKTQELAPINSSVAKPAFYVNKEGETISSFGFRL